MARAIPWPRIFTEALVIVASILLALAIDSWWQGIQEARLADGYLERLEVDLNRDLANWEGELRRLESKEAGLDEALRWVRDPSWDPASVDSLLAALIQGTRLAYEGGLTAQKATYDELVSIGTLRLLPAEVLSNLQAYHRWVDVQRVRLVSRQTDYAPAVYRLIPRETEFSVQLSLSDTEKRRVAERVAAADLEASIIAERNRARLRRDIAGSLHETTLELLALIASSPSD